MFHLRQYMYQNSQIIDYVVIKRIQSPFVQRMAMVFGLSFIYASVPSKTFTVAVGNVPEFLSAHPTLRRRTYQGNFPWPLPKPI